MKMRKQYFNLEPSNTLAHVAQTDRERGIKPLGEFLYLADPYCF